MLTCRIAAWGIPVNRNQLVAVLKKHGFQGKASDLDAILAFVDENNIDLKMSEKGAALTENDIRKIHAKAIEVTLTDTDTGETMTGTVGPGPVQTEGEEPEEKMEDEEEEKAAKSVKPKPRTSGKTVSDVFRAQAPNVSTRNTEKHRYEHRVKQYGVGIGRGQAKFVDPDCAEAAGAFFRTVACKSRGIVNPKAKSDAEILQKTNTTYDFGSAGATVRGGFLDDFIYIVEKYGVTQKLMSTTSMPEGSLDVMRSLDGTTVYAVGEGASITASDLSVDLINLTAGKYAAYSVVTNELLDDSAISIGERLSEEFGQKFAQKRDNLVFNANGEAAYHGQTGFTNALLGVDGTVANIKALQVASGNTWAEIVIGDIFGMIGRLLHSDNAKQPVFTCSRQFAWQVLFPAVGAYLGTSIGDVSASNFETPGGEGPDFKVLGYDGFYTQVMPTAEANSSIALMFGDFDRAAKFGNVTGGMKFGSSEHAAFASDAIAFRATDRFGVRVHDVGSTTEQSPVVGLITASS